MKLKHKIYLFQLFFTAIVLSFIFFTYQSYKAHYSRDLEEYIQEKVEFYKEQFINSYTEAYAKFEQKKKLFYSIHQRARDLLLKDPNMDLQKLAFLLQREFHLQDIKIDIYLIDKNYVIYKTTFAKDLGFNLSVIKDAKEFLDRVTRDKNLIYVADFVSTDALNMEYKLYTYSYLSKNNYLELGFSDRSVYNSFQTLVQKNLMNSQSIKLYAIINKEQGYDYYPFLEKKNLTKSAFYKQMKHVPHGLKSYDEILSAYRSKKMIVEYRENYAFVTTVVFDHNMYKKTGYDNLVLQVKIDIASKVAALYHYQNIFYLSVILALLFLSLIYFMINHYFTKPIETILSSIHDKKEVDDSKLLTQNDELAIIAKEYNSLLHSLNREILSNRVLLEENKRFIADTVHQIRTPLTNIMMNSEMIKRQDKEQKSLNFIDQINASINMLTNSYEDLSYTISSDTIDYKPSLVDISKALQERVRFFETLAKVNFKTLETKFDDEIFFNINQIELERLIDNNISNAIKYAEPNSVITSILTKEGDSIVLVFKSFGKEIVDQERVFEKNYREDESKRGLGLGLNMVKNICKKYNISYSLHYEAGQNIFTYILKGS